MLTSQQPQTQGTPRSTITTPCAEIKPRRSRWPRRKELSRSPCREDRRGSAGPRRQGGCPASGRRTRPRPGRCSRGRGEVVIALVVRHRIWLRGQGQGSIQEEQWSVAVRIGPSVVVVDSGMAPGHRFVGVGGRGVRISGRGRVCGLEAKVPSLTPRWKKARR
jgi:hypothetical protein